jgi:hypothetical protein
MYVSPLPVSHPMYVIWGGGYMYFVYDTEDLGGRGLSVFE